MNPILIFRALTIAQAIGKYFGIIDSVSSDVKKLLHQSFNSAIKNLEYAKSATSIQNQLDYIKQAKDEFIRALTTETDENLVSTYLGLAMCQYYLDDKINAENTLRQINNISLSRSERNRAIALDAIIPDDIIFSPIITPISRITERFYGIKGTHELKRENSLKEYKQKILGE